MRYRVEELAAAAGVNVDTIRFYQRRGLLAPPVRKGRVAFYDSEHLARLREIQRLARGGFKLEQIVRLAKPAAPQLLSALIEEGVGARTYSRAELAALSGISEPVLAVVQRSGLLQPVSIDGEERFSESDLGMCRAALVIFGSGLPIPELLALASEHARAIETSADRAIAIFENRARAAGAGDGAPLDLAALFRQLLPEATRLVALHFHTTIVRRALARLADVGEAREVEAALNAAAAGRLEVAWR
ncbi:MAG TPA: MerR family transcriptional regulator [Myxococcota bacterium]|nr:MerR family transcriptional regulator [Myxococcota bacterium]